MNQSLSTLPGDMPAGSRSFDWVVYADATLAGLSVLIPIPFLDSAVESFFRRRMAPTIVRRNGKTLHPTARNTINRTRASDIALSILLWPFQLTVGLLVRLSRKLLYFLTVKKAVDALVYYWQRAFLLDYLVQRGYITQGSGRDEAQAERAIVILDQLLAQEKGLPLRHLAVQVIRHTSHIGRLLLHGLQGKEDAEMSGVRADMATSWDNLSGYWGNLALRYEEMYRTHS